MNRSQILILVLLFLISCGQQQEKKKTKDSSRDEDRTEDYRGNRDDSNTASSDEEKVIDMVFALPEVVEYNAMLADATESGAIVMIDGMVELDGIDYYWVKVMEDNGSNYVTNFNFYVNPDNNEIKYYDVITDQAISLAEWRKQDF
jgi:hypothetical protein